MGLKSGDSGYHKPSSAKPASGAGMVSSGSPGAFAKSVTQNKDTSMSRMAAKGGSPKMKTVTRDE